jgi:hypothetical protein
MDHDTGHGDGASGGSDALKISGVRGSGRDSQRDFVID